MEDICFELTYRGRINQRQWRVFDLYLYLDLIQASGVSLQIKSPRKLQVRESPRKKKLIVYLQVQKRRCLSFLVNMNFSNVSIFEIDTCGLCTVIGRLSSFNYLGTTIGGALSQMSQSSLYHSITILDITWRSVPLCGTEMLLLVSF